MSETRRITSIAALWIVGITAAHLWLNVDWTSMLNDRLPVEKRRLNVAYIPVT